MFGAAAAMLLLLFFFHYLNSALTKSKVILEITAEYLMNFTFLNLFFFTLVYVLGVTDAFLKDQFIFKHESHNLNRGKEELVIKTIVYLSREECVRQDGGREAEIDTKLP